MRVLILHNAGSSELPSGELVVVREEARALESRGTEVRLDVVYNDRLARIDPVRKALAGVQVFWSPSSFRYTANLIREFRPDVVHAHGVLPLLTVSSFAACRAARVPVVQTLHNYRWLCVEGGLFKAGAYCDDCLHRGASQGIRHRCSRSSLVISTLLTANNAVWVHRGKLFDLVDRFLAVSEFVRRKHLEAGFPEERITVKRNAIELAGLQDRIVDPGSRRGVAFVGRLSPAKGTATLLQLFPLLGDTSLDIVGDGPERGVFEQAIRDGGFDNVTLHGQVRKERAREIVGRAACVVVPSISAEACPLVAIEALALGTPIVASRIGGLIEIVEGSAGGVTVTPGDPEAFVSELRDIYGTTARIDQMGRNGREHVRRYFSMQNSIERLLEIYRGVMSS